MNALQQIDETYAKGTSQIAYKNSWVSLLEQIIEGDNALLLAEIIYNKFDYKIPHITIEDLRTIPSLTDEEVEYIARFLRNIYDVIRLGNENAGGLSEEEQRLLFEFPIVEKSSHDIQAERVTETRFHVPQFKKNHFQLYNRRYIGSKHKLIDWIFSAISRECKGTSFVDIFAGTGAVSAVALDHFDKVILNDFLYSNEVIYNAFFDTGKWNPDNVYALIKEYNNLNGEDLKDNYFSLHYGGKYFSKNSAKIIGEIRENIEQNKDELTKREKNILIASLLYSTDKIANTVGHYDAYFKKPNIGDNFFMRPIDPVTTKSKVKIFREDANILAKKVSADIAYIDPPYNSRQYSRFYHLLETLTKWDKPELHGVALKPEPENMSDYCRVNAKTKFNDLVGNIDAKYLVVSYNNTYESKSSSSQNKITLDEIKQILEKRGQTKIFEKEHRHFNAGNTDFNNHKEYLFITKAA